MARVLKILAYAVILFLIYLVITGFLKSCNNDNKVASAELEQDTDIFAEDDIFEDSDSGSDELTINSDQINDASDPIDYNEIDAAIEERKTETTDRAASSSDGSSGVSSYEKSTYSSGDYMVIAGNYIINTNAENMVLKLKKMGYNTSEIVVFDFSQYHSVVARRFTDYDEAYRLSQELVSKGIDSYVHRKK